MLPSHEGSIGFIALGLEQGTFSEREEVGRRIKEENDFEVHPNRDDMTTQTVIVETRNPNIKR